MIYEVTTTTQADDDLRGIYEYIAFELLSPDNNYLVFYVPDKEAGVVTVIRVMYAGRNIDSQLNDHTARFTPPQTSHPS